ncbi:MAG: glycosyltransferase [Planctomycetaceae bacterium]
MTARRVLHVINNLNLGGAEMMLVRLLGRLDRTRWSPHVVSLIGGGPAAERLESIGVPVTFLGMRRGLPGPVSLLRLLRSVHMNSPDLVQTWLYHSDLLGGLATRLVRPGVPLVWNLRMNGPTPGRDKWTTCWTARASAVLSRWLPERIIVNSSAGRDVHRGLGYDAERLEVIPNGFDTDRFVPSLESRLAMRRELGVAVDTRLIGMAARWDPLKDFETALSAAAVVMARHADVHVVMCGTGVDYDNAELVKLAGKFGCDQRLHLLGRRGDMPAWQAALDVAFLASHTEGLPNTVGEAMACGVPCVVTDAGGSAQLVGAAGRVVPVGDAGKLACAIDELLQMTPVQRQRIGDGGRRRIIEEFSLEQMVERFEQSWENVLGLPPRQDHPILEQAA